MISTVSFPMMMHSKKKPQKKGKMFTFLHILGKKEGTGTFLLQCKSIMHYDMLSEIH